MLFMSILLQKSLLLLLKVKVIAFTIWEIKKKPEIANNEKYAARHWRQIFPVVENPEIIKFDSNDISYYNYCIEGLLLSYFHNGIDLNPDYQRSSVWTEEQKVKLIDSIYRHINIGSIVLVEKKWFNNQEIVSDMYEILDGKQRLSAIIDYVSSKFPYRGKYYYELSGATRSEFENQQILVGKLSLGRGGAAYDKNKVIEQFIRLNECGTSMDISVIERAKQMIEKH